MELIEDSNVSSIRDAIYVMLARSKTTGEPYEVSYEQLADMIDFPGPIGPSEIENALNSDPSLAAIVADFDSSTITVDTNVESMPDDLSNIGMMPGMGPSPGAAPLGAAPLGAAPPGAAPLGSPADVAPQMPQQEPAMTVSPADRVGAAADRALKRRGL